MVFEDTLSYCKIKRHIETVSSVKDRVLSTNFSQMIYDTPLSFV